jgi:uncharacterized phage protein (TIGR01671 family)
MREIKFRAWDRLNKLLLYHFLIPSDGGALFALREPNTPQGDDIGMLGMLPMSSTVVLMQCTGLKDKNGREIYDGDLLKTPSGNIDVVEWEEERIGFGCGYPEMRAIDMSEAEVIGNIYENPELVK